jgi:hypothetical protein
MKTSQAPNSLNFFLTIGKLKRLKRTGWVNHFIPEPESVADHMYRMSMMAFLISDPTVDRDHLIKLCLVHDIAEATGFYVFIHLIPHSFAQLATLLRMMVYPRKKKDYLKRCLLSFLPHH